MDKIAGRDCRDCTGCRPEIPRLQGLLGLPNFQSEIAESHDQDCWDCDGDCRPILQRLQRLLGVPRMQIFPGLPRLPRLSPEIDGITDIAGRGWVITCWDWKNFLSCRTGLPGLHRLPPKNTEIARVAGIDENAEFADRDCQDSERECLPRSPANIVKTAEIFKSVSQDCRGYRYCRPRVGDCKLRLKKLTRLPDGFAWTAETAAKKNAEIGGVAESVEFSVRDAVNPEQDCWDCNGDCRPTLQRLQRLMSVPTMQIFPRLSRSRRLSPKIAGITDNASREWLITCWDWKNYLSCRTGLPGLQRM